MSKDLSDLDYGQEYFWKIVADDGQDPQPSSTRNFTVKGEPTLSLSEPNADATDLLPDVSLRWSAENVQKLTLYLGVGDSHNMVVKVDSLPQGATSHIVEDLQYGQEYYWKIVAFDGQRTDISSTRKFTIKNRPSVEALSPDVRDGLQFPNLTLSWKGSSVDSYKIYFDTQNTFASATVIPKGSLATTSHELTGLDYDQTYYWFLEGSDDQDIIVSDTLSFTIKGRPSVSLSTPADDTTQQFPRPTLSWKSANVKSYDLWRGTAADNMVKIDSNLTGTSQEFTGLSYSQEYYWKVVADDEQTIVTSDTFKFTTKGEPSISLSEPADDTKNLLPNVDLEWKVSNVINQTLYVDGDNGDKLVYSLYGDDSSKKLIGLTYGQAYTWKIVTFDGQTTVTSDTHSFTIKPKPSVKLSAPASVASGQRADLSLSWIGKDANHYIVWLGTKSDDLIAFSDTCFDTSKSLAGLLEYGQDYYWQIQAFDEYNDEFSSIREFSTKEAPLVSLEQPANETTELFPETTLSWSASSFDTLTIYIDTIAEGNMKIATSLLKDDGSSYLTQNLEYGKTYYWKIVADDRYTRDTSEIRSFTTKRAPAVGLFAPEDGVQKQFPETTLSWSASHARKLTLYVDMIDDENMAVLVDSLAGDVTSYVLENLSYDRTYFWKIVADDGQTIATSSTYSFTTKGEPSLGLIKPAQKGRTLLPSDTLSWEASNLTELTLYFDTIEGEDMSVELFKDALIGNESRIVDSLQYGQTYYWKIIAFDGQDTLTSATRSLLYKNLPVVEAIAPKVDGNWKYPTTTFSWQGSDVSAYDLYLGTSSNNMEIKKGDLTDTTWTLHGLKHGQPYFWKVVGREDDTSGVSGILDFTVKGAPALKLVSPAKLERVQSPVPTLTWSGDNVKTYDVWLGESEQSLVKICSDIEDTIHVPEGLSYGKTYYWMVVADDGQDTLASDPISFAVKDEPTLSLNAPSDNDWIYNSTVDFSWEAANIDSFYFSLTCSGESSVNQLLAGNHRNYSKSGLKFGKRYTWRVTAYNGKDVLRSEYRHFDVKAAPVVNLSAPADEKQATFPKVDLSWSGENALTYTLYLDTKSTNMHIEKSGITKNSHQLTDLQYGQTYYWRVEGINPKNSTKSSIRSFTVKNRPTISLNSPYNLAQNQKRTLTLEWSGNNVETYDVYFGRSESNLIKVKGGTRETSHDITDELERNRTYYWKVEATDNDVTISSSIYNFKTRASVSVECDAPQYGSMGHGESVNIRWHGNAECYSLLYKKSTTSAYTVALSRSTSTSYTLTKLDADSDYHFKIIGHAEGEDNRETAVYPFSTKKLINSLGVEMKLVEAGTFTMGSSQENNAPEHSETISESFYMSKYEITNGQARDLIHWARDYYGDALKIYDSYGSVCVDLNNVTLYYGKGAFTCDYGEMILQVNKDYPCENLTYYGAKAMATFLNAKEGTTKYRVPTEVEWEYAARGGNKSHGYIYSGSNTASEVARYGWTNTDHSFEVGEKAANELGLHDMSGGVFEWCSNLYGDYEGFTAPPETKDHGVIRGGYYRQAMEFCRVSFRSSILLNTGTSGVGVRLMRDK